MSPDTLVFMCIPMAPSWCHEQLPGTWNTPGHPHPLPGGQQVTHARFCPNVTVPTGQTPAKQMGQIVGHGDGMSRGDASAGSGRNQDSPPDLDCGGAQQEGPSPVHQNILDTRNTSQRDRCRSHADRRNNTRRPSGCTERSCRGPQSRLAQAQHTAGPAQLRLEAEGGVARTGHWTERCSPACTQRPAKCFLQGSWGATRHAHVPPAGSNSPPPRPPGWTSRTPSADPSLPQPPRSSSAKGFSAASAQGAAAEAVCTPQP